jgi:transcriptional regulator with XRE-family HTH domain
MREYAEFIGVTHPTISHYINDPEHSIRWDFLVKLSAATHVDIGTLARIAAPDVASEAIPDARVITDRINQLPPTYRKTIIEMVDALLYQQKRPKNQK